MNRSTNVGFKVVDRMIAGCGNIGKRSQMNDSVGSDCLNGFVNKILIADVGVAVVRVRQLDRIEKLERVANKAPISVYRAMSLSFISHAGSQLNDGPLRFQTAASHMTCCSTRTDVCGRSWRTCARRRANSSSRTRSSRATNRSWRCTSDSRRVTVASWRWSHR